MRFPAVSAGQKPLVPYRMESMDPLDAFDPGGEETGVQIPPPVVPVAAGTAVVEESGGVAAYCSGSSSSGWTMPEEVVKLRLAAVGQVAVSAAVAAEYAAVRPLSEVEGFAAAAVPLVSAVPVVPSWALVCNDTSCR